MLVIKSIFKKVFPAFQPLVGHIIKNVAFTVASGYINIDTTQIKHLHYRLFVWML